MATPTRKPPRGPAARGPRQAVPPYDQESLRVAAVTVVRIADLIGMRAGRGDPDQRGKERAARHSGLPPSFRAAMEGELMLLRAQLFGSGLFAEIINVDLGGGG